MMKFIPGNDFKSLHLFITFSSDEQASVIRGDDAVSQAYVGVLKNLYDADSWNVLTDAVGQLPLGKQKSLYMRAILFGFCSKDFGDCDEIVSHISSVLDLDVLAKGDDFAETLADKASNLSALLAFLLAPEKIDFPLKNLCALIESKVVAFEKAIAAQSELLSPFVICMVRAIAHYICYRGRQEQFQEWLSGLLERLPTKSKILVPMLRIVGGIIFAQSEDQSQAIQQGVYSSLETVKFCGEMLDNPLLSQLFQDYFTAEATSEDFLNLTDAMEVVFNFDALKTLSFMRDVFLSADMKNKPFSVWSEALVRKTNVLSGFGIQKRDALIKAVHLQQPAESATVGDLSKMIGEQVAPLMTLLTAVQAQMNTMSQKLDALEVTAGNTATDVSNNQSTLAVLQTQLNAVHEKVTQEKSFFS